MGTGKSKLTLDVAGFMYDNGWIDALMIFANKGSYTNWVDEHIPEHLPNHIDSEIALWKSNAKVAERDKIREVFYSQELTLKIFVMNIEALAYERSTKIALKFVQNHNTLSIIDESTTIKNPKAKRTKMAWKIGRASIARRILTGSCVDNRPLDAWAQFEFLKKGLLGYTSYYSFRAEYADLKEMQLPNRQKAFKIVVGYKNLDRLQKSLTKYGSIVKSEDCLDLPPKIYEKYYVELTPEQKKHYTELRKNCITFLEEQSMVSVKIALTKILRLQQLVAGYLKDDDGIMHTIPHNRLTALESILDETNGRAIIWVANNTAAIDEIYNHLLKGYNKDEVLRYYGNTSQEDRTFAKKALKKGSGSKVRWMVGNPTVGGYGLNLTGVNTVVYYINSYDNEVRQQSEKRAHRIGQTKTVTYIDIIARKTVDEKVIRALLNKKDISNMITQSNWREWF
jgi:SNF2 family DNA or RNA helicase